MTTKKSAVRAGKAERSGGDSEGMTAARGEGPAGKAAKSAGDSEGKAAKSGGDSEGMTAARGEGREGKAAKSGGDSEGMTAARGEGREGKAAKSGGDSEGMTAARGEGIDRERWKVHIDPAPYALKELRNVETTVEIGIEAEAPNTLHAGLRKSGNEPTVLATAATTVLYEGAKVRTSRRSERVAAAISLNAQGDAT